MNARIGKVYTFLSFARMDPEQIKGEAKQNRGSR